MIDFILNGKQRSFDGDEKLSLIKYLREVENLTSVKDGCSGQGTCGACTIEFNGAARLSCTIPMSKVAGAKINTIEGFEENLSESLGKAFAVKGAVQCGFCTPGIIVRTKVLLENNSDPSDADIIKALNPHICRCTGYKKIVEAVRYAASCLREKKEPTSDNNLGAVGTRQGKYQAVDTALGRRPFVDDLRFKEMHYGVLKFSDHPRAKILSIDPSDALKRDGVLKVLLSSDIPGERYQGLILQDWPLMVGIGDITRYVGDVVASVIATSEDLAREAAKLIKVEYEVLEPVVDMHKGLETSAPKVHEKGNLLELCQVSRGEPIDKAIKDSDFLVTGIYETQRIEHGFLETEATVARPLKGGDLELYSCGQGVYVDQKLVAKVLGMDIENIHVIQVANGGGFGGKEDMTTQGHAALMAKILDKPVKVHLSREESLRMHPKRHPLWMDYTVGCSKEGKLTALKARIVGDTGAYASVGAKVLERAVGHATGAYQVDNVDLEGKTVYTNNPPCGAMRGFGANQATFAMESCIDELCEKGGFDRWQFRYDNALQEGSMTATGQILKGGIGVKDCLKALKEKFDNAKYAGISCGIKNTGVGNGMPDSSKAKIVIEAANKVVIHHGWTEMGQGVHTMAQQTLCQETGIDPSIVEVMVDTREKAEAGMTTSSRGTSLLGNAIIDACKKLKEDLKNKELKDLVGTKYWGEWICDFTTVPGTEKEGEEVVTHYSYGYAAQLCVLDDKGEIDTLYAAHDAGKVMNPMLFEGQIEGSLHMGLGYTLCEDFPTEGGHPVSYKYKDCQIIRIKDTPKFEVIGIEAKDLYGPYGAKGVGEIGLVPTAPAITNALYQFDKVRRYTLPIARKKKSKKK